MKSDKLIILLIMAVALVSCCDCKIPKTEENAEEKETTIDLQNEVEHDEFEDMFKEEIEAEPIQIEREEDNGCDDNEFGFKKEYKTRFGLLRKQACSGYMDRIFLNDKLIIDLDDDENIEELNNPPTDSYPPIAYNLADVKTIVPYKKQDIIMLGLASSGNAYSFHECSLLILDKQDFNFIKVKNCRFQYENNFNPRLKDNLLYFDLGYHHWKNNYLVYDGKKAVLKAKFPKGKQIMDNDYCEFLYENRRKFCHENDIEDLGLIPSEIRDYRELFFGRVKGFNPFGFEKVCDKSKLAYQQFKAKACQINFDDKQLNKDKLSQWTNNEWDY